MIEAMPSKPEADAASGQLFGSAFAQGGELWMSTHRELLANLAAMMEGWLQLHRAAFDASSRALQKLHDCTTLAELFELQRGWASDFWGRIATTVPAIGGDGAPAVHRATARPREPAEAGRTDILVRRQPATISAAEATPAAE
jgi:hypothetical protein